MRRLVEERGPNMRATPLKILLLEDEEAHAEAVKRAFRKADSAVQVTWASRVKEALESTRRSAPDLVIADWLLPDGKGTDILPPCKEDHLFPVILMTSHGNEQVAVDAMKAGVVDYVVKSPAMFAEMPRLVVRVLREWNLFLENKRAQEALRASEERFRAIFMRASDQIFVTDKVGRFIQINPAFESLVGLSADEILGKTPVDVFGRQDTLLSGRLCERVMQGESIEGERTLKIRGVLVTFSYSLTPLRDSDGEVAGIFGITRDVTDRIRSAALEQESFEPGYTSKAMQAALTQGLMAARKDSTVLLLGESGSGKDWFARYIHNHSARAGGPYLSVNCAAIAPTLAESELFGHEKGAFTGAVGRKRGVFQLAEGGTLLLNEIGELPLGLQAKLLTFLDTKKFTRVGGEMEISVDVRLIAATNRDLKKEVEEGRFRSDLFYRLNVIEMNVPPLRERAKDIPVLSNEIASELAAQMQLPAVPTLDGSTISALVSYHWPGNVRELRNVLERALILWDGTQFDVALPSSEQKEQIRDYALTIDFRGRTLHDVTEEISRTMCLDVLQRCNGNKKEAAKLLGIARDTFYRYLREWGVL
jgi:two-component system, NtrC family, response regulator AtoC